MTGAPPTLDLKAIPPLWVLRHGQTEWNVAGRLQGLLDSPLTALGRQQAADQARILSALNLPGELDIISSPSGRTRATAEIAAAGLSLPVQCDDDLVEIGLGAWQGLLVEDIAPEMRTGPDDPHLWKFSGPGCESLTQLVARVSRFLAARKRPAVVVTHGVTSRVLRCVALGMAPQSLSDLPGGQGVVHHVAGGQARVLRLKPDHTVDAEGYDPKGAQRHTGP